MWGDSEQVLDSIFLSYNKILKRFKLLGVTTKDGKEISHEDLRKAVEVMLIIFIMIISNLILIKKNH